MVKDAGVGGRVGARGAADRRLVNHDGFVEKLNAVNPVVGAGDGLGVVQAGEQFVREDFVDEGGFAGAGDAGNYGHHPEREADGDVFEVIFASADHGEGLVFFGLAAFLGDRDGFLTGKITTGDRIGVLGDLFRSAGGDQAAAVFASAGTDVNQIIRGAHGVFVVFHYENGIFEVAEMLQGGDELIVVALMETDARLIQNIEDALEAGADLGGEADALSFPAREGVGGATELQIAETDVLHKLDALTDFFQNGLGDLLLGGRELQVAAEELQRGVHVKITNINDVAVVDGDGEDGGFETGAVAGLTFVDAHKTLNVFANELGVGLAVAAFQGRDDAFIGGLVGGAVAPFAVAADGDFVFLGAGAVEDFLDDVGGEFGDRGMDGEAVALTDSGETFQPPGFLVDAVKGADAAFGDGEVGIQDEVGINFQAGAEAGTGRAGTLGGVERKEARLQLGNQLIGVVFAGVALGVGEDFGVGFADGLAFNGGGVVVDFEQFDNSLPQFQGLFNGARDAGEQVGRKNKAVHHDF